MKPAGKLIVMGIVAVVLVSLLTIVSGADERETIFRVTATSLVVREEASVKARALFKLPRNSYVLNDSGSMMQSQAIETIANRKGRWIRVCGVNGNMIGYVFEGFLEKVQDVKSRPLGPECAIKADRIECGSEVFTYTEKTPIAGAWFLNPETAAGNISYIYENSSKLLKKITTSPGKEISAGGDIMMLIKGNAVVQFISTPPPRGYE
jgi:hypothetical protein